MLEAALAAGVAEGGGDAWLGGVLPTPAASILVRRHGLDLAAVVSASHNPWQHNGIKFFGADGRKLDDEAEAGIEARVAQAGSEPGVPTGRVRELDGALDDYLRALALGLPPRPLRAPRAARLRQRGHLPGRAGRLRAPRGEVETIGVEPDGRNINEGCGSTHPELLAEQRRPQRRRHRLRLRRRRRPGARGRRAGRGPRRRRADRALRPAPRRRAASSTAASPSP